MATEPAPSRSIPTAIAPGCLRLLNQAQQNRLLPWFEDLHTPAAGFPDCLYSGPIRKGFGAITDKTDGPC